MTSLLSDADLQLARGVLAESLGGSAVISGGTISDNGLGGGTLSRVPRGTVGCRIAPIRGTEREIGDRLAADAEWLVTVPGDTVVSTADQLQVTLTDHDGTFEVLAVRANSQAVSKRLECQEVN